MVWPGWQAAAGTMPLSPGSRPAILQTDYDMCRSEWMAQMQREDEAKEAARKPVIEAALNLLRSKGLTDQQIGNYRSIISAFLTVAENTQPGSTARDQGLADVFHSHQQPYFDQTLLHRLAELVMSLRDGRT